MMKDKSIAAMNPSVLFLYPGYPVYPVNFFPVAACLFDNSLERKAVKKPCFSQIDWF